MKYPASTKKTEIVLALRAIERHAATLAAAARFEHNARNARQIAGRARGMLRRLLAVR